MRFIPTPAEDAGGLNTGSGGRSCDIATTARKKMKSAMSNPSGLPRSHEQELLWLHFIDYAAGQTPVDSFGTVVAGRALER